MFVPKQTRHDDFQKVLCSRAVLFCYVQQDFSPLMRTNFSDPKAGRFMNYSCSQSHKIMRAKVTWSIKHSRLTLTFGGKLKSKSFKRGKSYAFATASLARSLCELIDLTSLALGLLTNFYPVLLTKRGREEASLVLKMQRPCSTGLPGWSMLGHCWMEHAGSFWTSYCTVVDVMEDVKSGLD